MRLLKTYFILESRLLSMMGDIRRLGAQVVTLARREKRAALYPANPLPFAMDRLFRVGQGAHLAPT